MPDSEYFEALKMGQKEYRACVARGEYPYLPVLDELLPSSQALSERPLGIVQVPAEYIVGTKTKGRTTMFAKNFMPLAPAASEFASKWSSLCQSHLEEGIRDAVTCYEYMNRYYVEEGNKRVSVLKYFGAVSIAAKVTRILPEKNPSKESQLYYEYVTFYELSHVNFLEFSKLGSYVRLQQLLGKAPDEVWSPEDHSRFLSCYYFFRQVYLSAGGGNLPLTVGDALLAFLEIYGYPSLRGKSVQELKKDLTKVWEEITLLGEETPIDLKMDPEDKKPGIITKVLSAAESKTLGVAFIHDGYPESSEWTRSHERGREYLSRVMGESIKTTAYYNALQEGAAAVMEQAIRDGHTTLFATSPRLFPDALKIAVQYPSVTVYGCALNQSHRYIRTYYARMYEVKFILGAIAGAMAGADPVGYICDYPIFGQVAGINAFALGVQMVNPNTRVYLEWSSVEGTEIALNRLKERGVRLISSLDMIRQGEESSLMGLNLYSEGKPTNLATPLWQWGTYYEEILRRIRNRTEQASYSESSKALNYYWGLSAGVVDLRCSKNVPVSIQKMADVLKKSIASGICNPFQGPLYTQDGTVLENDDLLSPKQIMEMDFLMENVIGDFPKYDKLSEVAKETVDLVGVEKVSKSPRRSE